MKRYFFSLFVVLLYSTAFGFGQEGDYGMPFYNERSSYSTVDSGAQSGVPDKETGDNLSAAEFTAVKNTADTADAQATTNDGRLTDIEAAMSLYGTVVSRDVADTVDPSGNPNGVPDNEAVEDRIDAKASAGGWGTGGIVIGTDPDQEAGLLGQDTDGANVPNDDSIRATDQSGNQYFVGKKLVHYQIPFNVSGATSVGQPWFNEEGADFNLTRIYCRSSVDDLAIGVDEITSFTNATILNTIVDLVADTNSTGIYTKTVQSAGMADTVVEAQHGIDLDIGAAAWGSCIIEGWYNADVD